MGILKDDDIWVCDTAASNHFSKNCDGAYNVRNTSTMSTGMSGASVDATMMDFVMTQYSKAGAEGERFKLTDVNYSKKFNYNLFSAARCLKNGWTMTGDREGITLFHPKGGHKLVFDIVIPTKNGALFATMLKKDTEVANAQVEKPQTMTLLQAHNKLGHCDIEKTRRTAKRLNWRLSDGVMDPCPACAAGKAKQRNVPKSSNRHKATKAGERWYHDISTISDRGNAKAAKKQWHLRVDEHSMYCVSTFYKEKNGFIEPTIYKYRAGQRNTSEWITQAKTRNLSRELPAPTGN